jgi:hypothetical protein
MAEIVLLDQAYHCVMQRLIDTGQAPHYTKSASELGLEMEVGKQPLHELIDSGIPAWLHPQTDYIVSFAPFHNLPTQYRITVNGEQRGDTSYDLTARQGPSSHRPWPAWSLMRSHPKAMIVIRSHLVDQVDFPGQIRPHGCFAVLAFLARS